MDHFPIADVRMSGFAKKFRCASQQLGVRSRLEGQRSDRVRQLSRKRLRYTGQKGQILIIKRRRGQEMVHDVFYPLPVTVALLENRPFTRLSKDNSIIKRDLECNTPFSSGLLERIKLLLKAF